MIGFLSSWKFKAGAAIGAAALLGMLSLYIWGLHAKIDVLEGKIEFVTGERNFAIEQYTQCLSDQRLTKEVSDEYQTEIDALNRQLRDLKRLRDNPTCVPITQPPCQCNVPTPERKPAGSHGLRTEWLYDFAAEGEQYRLQLIACQDFIRKTWERAEKN